MRGLKFVIYILFFGRFGPVSGPRSGSTSDIKRTQIEPRRPILRPFRDHFCMAADTTVRTGQTLMGPQISHIYFVLFAVGRKNTECPRMGLRIGLRG